MFLAFTNLFFLLIISSKAHTPGTVIVDTLTFDKIRYQFDVVLAKFDDKYPYGDKEEEFKKFAESVASSRKFIVVEIPISDYGDDENEQLALDYNIKKEDYPVYKLFLKNKDKPIDYVGDKTQTDLRRFLTQNTNVWFGLPGTVEELDHLAQQFFHASSNNDENTQRSLLEQTRERIKGLVKKQEQQSGESYLKIMEFTMKQGTEFLKRETQRVQNLLKGKITNDKKQELLHRSNILLSFKSLKESLTDSNNVAKNNIDNNEEQVIGDKDL